MTETAIFAAGCFWGVEDAFRKLPGVLETSVGYIGGQVDNPTYKQVCTDTTGHAEAVKVVYDPELITYETLLNVFWDCHDPTTLNRQGPDFGSQYRSAIFTTTDVQQALATTAKQELTQKNRFPRPIVTQIEPAPTFYIAEEYHQQYNEKNGRSCHI